MKKLLFQFAIWNIILISNTYAEAKNFKFYQKVKVISGFYEGCVGKVQNELLNNRYSVELSCKVLDDIMIIVSVHGTFNSEELEAINETK